LNLQINIHYYIIFSFIQLMESKIQKMSLQQIIMAIQDSILTPVLILKGVLNFSIFKYLDLWIHYVKLCKFIQEEAIIKFTVKFIIKATIKSTIKVINFIKIFNLTFDLNIIISHYSYRMGDIF